jgi:hypothetical protein
MTMECLQVVPILPADGSAINSLPFVSLGYFHEIRSFRRNFLNLLFVFLIVTMLDGMSDCEYAKRSP